MAMCGAMMKTIMCVALVLTVVGVPRPAEAIGCGTVVQYLSPCISFVMGGRLRGGCCGGIRKLYGMARSTRGRQSVCSCLKRLARSYSVNLGRAANLPRVCRVNIPYRISPSTNCARVR